MLQLGVDFAMTIGAKQFTLLKLRPDLLPTSRITFCRNTEILFGRFKVVYF